MQLIITGRNFNVTEALKNRVAAKLGKLDKFFRTETEGHVTMSVQKNRQIVEVTIPFNGVVIRAEEATSDMYASIDKAVDILEKQILRNKTRLSKKLHEEAFEPQHIKEYDEVKEEVDFNVVKSKKFAIKPMPVEEAVLQMNLLGHEFFMFTNADTKKANVVYRRKDGNYGLIEAEY
jgi:putative sigma-54 modulation protein